MDEAQDITILLENWKAGDQAALESLLPVVYNELRTIARKYLSRERADHTLMATDLVHEAFMKLIRQENMDWRNRTQFFAVSAQLIKRILLDHARAKNAEKRGGNAMMVTLGGAEEISGGGPNPDIEMLNQALIALEAFDPRQSRIVELRFFAGLTNDEIAEVLGLSKVTIQREWKMARAWLHRFIKLEGEPPSGPID